jgi:hypothetical protein
MIQKFIEAKVKQIEQFSISVEGCFSKIVTFAAYLYGKYG